jgi:hypothetical protein
MGHSPSRVSKILCLAAEKMPVCFVAVDGSRYSNSFHRLLHRLCAYGIIDSTQQAFSFLIIIRSQTFKPAKTAV